ncbi:MAG: polysaccharide deacetylase family protein [Lawsonibacter sp.]|nr:polysaccharide deacetylase family protein [Lawsonibacter sp.]
MGLKKKLLLLGILCMAAAIGPAVRLEQTVGGGAVMEISQKPPLVALTFDDGPRNSTTGRLLEGLALREVPATFFLVGSRIPGSESLIQEMAAAGHQIGVHTFDHIQVTELSHRDFDLQVGKTRALLADILGSRDFWLRPPYGIVDATARQWADGPLILWSVDPEDWKDSDVNRIVATVTEQAEDGDIILMHDIYDSSVDAALRIVDTLLARGYCFVTVEQLMQLRDTAPERGALYTSLPPGR